MRKILVAIDGSPGALKAVEHIGKLFCGVPEVEITLFHVLPYLPAKLRDEGHILSGKEREELRREVAEWLSGEEKAAQPIFSRAIKVLLERGIGPGRIRTRSISDSTDVAGSILEEVRTGGYDAVAMGRCGHSRAKDLVPGSITGKVIGKGTGAAIYVVE